jgi:hypothetical protein
MSRYLMPDPDPLEETPMPNQQRACHYCGASSDLIGCVIETGVEAEPYRSAFRCIDRAACSRRPSHAPSEPPAEFGSTEEPR